MMTREELRQRIENIDRLTVNPRVSAALFRTMDEGESRVGGLVDVVSSDPGLAAVVMRVAGGANGASGSPICSIADAVNRLGRGSLQDVGRMVTATSAPAAPTKHVEDVTTLVAHSIACGIWTACIAEHVQSEFRSLAYTAGLLHDLGKLALLSIAESGEESGNERSGISHTLAGKWLSERWGLPEFITDVAWLHHHSLTTIVALRQTHSELIAMVSLANMLSHDPGAFVPEELLRHFRLGAAELDALRAQAQTRVAQAQNAMLDTPTDKRGLDSMRARTDLLERLLILEQENRRFRALNELHLKLRPGLPLEQALLAIVESVRTALQVAPGLCYIADSREQWVHGKSWRTLDDTPRDLVLSLRGATPAERVDLDAQLLCAIQSLALGSKGSATPLQSDSPWRRGGFAALPILDLGAKSAHIIFDSAGSNRVFSPDDAQDLVTFIQSCGIALRRYISENRVAAQVEDFAELLENERRVTAEPSAQLGSDALKTFVAGATHHINNPLTVISGRAQQLVGKVATPAEVKALDDIVAHSHRITRILGDLMAFSSAEPPRMEPALINVMIQQTLAGMRQRLTAKKIRIVEHYGEGLPRVRVDRRQMGVVIANLVKNAESSMGGAGGVLTIETKPAVDHKSVVVRVTDTGHGVAPEIATKIFTPFFSTHDGGDALGLGLAASRGIVTAHHGVIRLVPQSEPGATFEITLPVSTEAAVFPALRTTAAPEAAAPPRQRTILIANDDEDLREILTETFHKRGYLVHAVSNGVQALETVRTRPVDLVLMDTRMPERDGLSVLTELSSQYASLPVILITNRASREETEEAIRLGARSCLSKPFEIKRLLSEVERFVVNS